MGISFERARRHAYAECLTTRESFDTLTLDRFVEVAEHHVRDPWVTDLRDRYLGWEKIDALVDG